MTKKVLPYNLEYSISNNEEPTNSLSSVVEIVAQAKPDEIVENNDLIFSMYEKDLRDKISKKSSSSLKNTKKHKTIN